MGENYVESIPRYLSFSDRASCDEIVCKPPELY